MLIREGAKFKNFVDQLVCDFATVFPVKPLFRNLSQLFLQLCFVFGCLLWQLNCKYLKRASNQVKTYRAGLTQSHSGPVVSFTVIVSKYTKDPFLEASLIFKQ